MTTKKHSRDALPHDVQSYRDLAAEITMQEFETRFAYPFFLYGRSNLWDRTLILANSMGKGAETQMVDYNVLAGGMTFLSAVKKVQSDAGSPVITVGRDKDNDVVVPVTSVSGHHLDIHPPSAEQPYWAISDKGSKNGTFFEETQMDSEGSVRIDDGKYLRLGGNLIAWFFYPGHIWKLLRDQEAMNKFTNL